MHIVMKQVYRVLFLFLLVLLPFAAATPDLEIQKIDQGSTVIPELDNAGHYQFIINNRGPADLFEIYTLVGVTMSPTEMFNLTQGITKLDVQAYPREEIRDREGYFTFEYQIKGINSGIFKDTLRLRFVPLKDAVEIIAQPINVGASSEVITLRNKHNTNIETIPLQLSAPFFDTTYELALGPYEEVNLTVPLNTARLRPLLAGPYTITATFQTPSNKTVTSQGIVTYLEKEGTSVEKKTTGFIIRKTTVSKKNEGNIPATATVEITEDIFSRLFTTHSIEPHTIQRNGMSVTYTWQKELAPAEVYAITATTNYTVPFIIILLLVFIIIAAKMYAMTPITVQKKVNFVKTRGGELALKVSLHVKARKYVEKIQVIDQLPAMAKLYEKFGKSPDRIDHSARRMYWNIESLNAGEERVYTYIIYSKMKVVGRFELPPASAIFDYKGKMQEVWSNRAFFVSETSDVSVDKGFS